MTGLTRQQAAEAVAALFGTSARQTHESTIYDPWEVIDRDGKKWRFVFDSSIKATMRDGRRQIPATSGLYKVEMNSPKLSYEEMGKLQEVVRTLRHAGAVVNGSCGMHVHVDASRHTPQSLKNALSIMYSKEDILFKALNVNEARVERWCQKVREPMLEKIRKLPGLIEIPDIHCDMKRVLREWPFVLYAFKPSPVLGQQRISFCFFVKEKVEGWHLLFHQLFCVFNHLVHAQPPLCKLTHII